MAATPSFSWMASGPYHLRRRQSFERRERLEQLPCSRVVLAIERGQGVSDRLGGVRPSDRLEQPLRRRIVPASEGRLSVAERSAWRRAAGCRDHSRRCDNLPGGFVLSGLPAADSVCASPAGAAADGDAAFARLSPSTAAGPGSGERGRRLGLDLQFGRRRGRRLDKFVLLFAFFRLGNCLGNQTGVRRHGATLRPCTAARVPTP